eukprot:1900067-Rhodomonas_salina.1
MEIVTDVATIISGSVADHGDCQRHAAARPARAVQAAVRPGLLRASPPSRHGRRALRLQREFDEM